MTEISLIKDYFYASNYLVLCQMYLNEYKNPSELQIEDLKNYNPGHLGSSIGINFLLSNLNYFLNANKLKNKIIIGTGHSGVSLSSNCWLNGSLQEKYSEYPNDLNGLNNLIYNFGRTIRSEINPEYPNTIYDGGELGYSLSVAYGYALNGSVDIIPCIIGDGEAETGTLSSSWYLNKLLNTNSKVLPIINLNGFKMGSNSYLSRMTNKELLNYYEALGYYVKIIDVSDYEDIQKTINKVQETLNECLTINKPLLIFKSPKGWTIPNLENIIVENNISSHKNPLIDLEKQEKFVVLKKYLEKYYKNLFDFNLIEKFIEKFSIINLEDTLKEINIPNNKELNLENKKINIEYAEEFLVELLTKNDTLLFSPDEIYSNKLGKISKNTFEILNENVLQGLLQGYIQSGNNSVFIGYEGFMPIVSSMVTQYYKYLKQKSELSNVEKKGSLNYLLTSICWENTYSHQNPGFINDLLVKEDDFYNVLFPKDGNNLIKCLEESMNTKDMINVITTSKREKRQYQTYEESSTTIDVVLHSENPDIILCATGDYMLSQTMNVVEKLKETKPEINIKVVYITNPKVLDVNSKKAITEDEFNYFFNENIPVVYLFSGYSNIAKSLLYDRNVNFKVFGYNDQISIFGGINQNLESNGLSVDNITKICNNEIVKNKQRIIKKRG